MLMHKEGKCRERFKQTVCLGGGRGKGGEVRAGTEKAAVLLIVVFVIRADACSNPESAAPVGIAVPWYSGFHDERHA